MTMGWCVSIKEKTWDLHMYAKGLESRNTQKNS